MKLTLRQLEIFRAIARNGSTSDAARQLPLSQSATSAALLELETTLKVSLFDRVGKRLLLNDHGRTLLPAALSLIDGAGVRASRLCRGRRPLVDLKVFGSMTIGNYLLPSLIAGFTRLNQGAKIDLRVGNSHDVVAAVREFGAGLGIHRRPCHESDVQVTPWLDDELVVVAAPDHPLARAAKRTRLSGEQLSRARWLMREPGSGTRETVEHLLLPHLAQLSAVITMGQSGGHQKRRHRGARGHLHLALRRCGIDRRQAADAARHAAAEIDATLHADPPRQEDAVGASWPLHNPC